MREPMARMAARIARFFLPNIFVSPERLYPVLKEALDEAVPPGDVLEIDTAIADEDEARQAFSERGRTGGVVLVRCPTRLPTALRRLIRQFYKDGEVPRANGRPGLSHRAAADFTVVLWATPKTYLDMDETERSLLMETVSHRFYYPEDPNAREDLGTLTASRRATHADPVSTLSELGSDRERRELFLKMFPPTPGRGFDRHDRELVSLIKGAAQQNIHSFLLSVFAEHDDYYLMSECFKNGLTPDQESIDRAAEALVNARHLGGQHRPYWDALGALSSHPQVRSFIKTILEDRRPMNLAAEDVLYVLREVGAWPEVAGVVRQIADSASDEAIRELAAEVLDGTP